VATTTAYKRLFLQGLKWKSEDTGTTLFANIKASCQSQLEVTASGLVLVSGSGNGTSFSYVLPSGSSSVTPNDVADLNALMLWLYDKVKAALIAGGKPTPTDAEIFAGMMDKLVSFPTIEPDYSCLQK
jgi:hypothetical protein